ncbi:hypothetical protein HYDPIDRAFT_30843 [Hydnomerulius pinastri MD-312]|uniref:F-box domain-containing protein n=1 Tax=Hydnomerulius pinastri MD-312 TaxID=994086 RepID=A0A0C9V8J9_9AGAM|nr:hypothetical protein HYDPIDRAFT_30843 [Hydnomerulius pinastri MD-312]
MHRALLLPELLRYLFSYFEELDRDNWPMVPTPSRKALAALARTCRAFQDPALDVLWAELNEPNPLVKCMPSKLWPSIYRGEHRDLPFTEEEWSIFQKYAPRVHSLVFQLSVPLYRNILAVWSSAPVTQPLFPNLQHLGYEHFIPEDFALVPLVMGPSLTSLDIEVHPLGFPDLGLLASALQSCSYIRSFGLYGYRGDDQQVVAVSDILSGLTLLKKLRCDQLTDAALLKIFDMSSLRDIRIEISPHQSRLFTAQREFGRHTYPLSARLLSHRAYSMFLSPKRLRKDNCPIFSSATALLRDHSTLSSLRLHVKGDRDVRHRATIPLTTLTSLQRFVNLRELDIQVGYAYEFTDTNIKELVTAWPELETLYINKGIGWHSPSSITLSGLFAVTSTCSKLRNLCLCIDAVMLDALPDRILPQSQVLENLFLEDSTLQQPAAVALLLASAFPALKQVIAWDSETLLQTAGRENYQKLWQTVSASIPSYRWIMEGHWRALAAAQAS